MGTEAVNYATGIKAKAMVLLADFIDAGQADGSIRTKEQGRPDKCSAEEHLSVPEVLGTEDSQQARRAVYEARRLRDALAGADVDDLVARANEAGDDLGIRGLHAAGRGIGQVMARREVPHVSRFFSGTLATRETA